MKRRNGFERRKDGIERALTGHEIWRLQAIEIFKRSFARGDFVTGELVRLQCEASGIERPRHHNAWSALTSSLRSQGLIRDTGQWKFAVDPKAHARRLPIWQVV